MSETIAMLNLHLITVGKLKETYWQVAETEYVKRLKPYAKISLTEIKEEPFRTESDWQKSKEKEAEKILAAVPNGSTLIICSEDGKTFTSIELAQFLDKQSSAGAQLTLVMGGSLGLHDTVRKAARYTLSLSPLTFPHQLARVILLEQLYRAGTIIAGKQYHY